MIPPSDQLLREQRPILFTIDEANALQYGIINLMTIAHKDGDINICLHLNGMREKCLAAFTPEEWEAYSKIINEHTSPGEF